MSECWHYIRFGTLSDGTITGMHCTSLHIGYGPRFVKPNSNSYVRLSYIRFGRQGIKSVSSSISLFPSQTNVIFKSWVRARVHLCICFLCIRKFPRLVSLQFATLTIARIDAVNNFYKPALFKWRRYTWRVWTRTQKQLQYSAKRWRLGCVNLPRGQR